jgi:hypothetical protein
VYNCCAIKTHLFALIGPTTTGSVDIKNNIAYLTVCGAIDKDGSSGTLVSDYNVWWPTFTGAGNWLGYNSQANWPVTGPHDFPPNASTAIGTVVALIAAGGVDPDLYGINASAVDGLVDADLYAIRLKSTSPCLYAGTNIGAGSYYLDGTEIPDV